jgi:hypothetical protein
MRMVRVKPSAVGLLRIPLSSTAGADAVEEGERSHVPVAERFCVSAGYATTKIASECGRSIAKKMDLAFNAADHADGFAEVRLAMARWMNERHEHLLCPLAPTRHVVLHNRDLVSEPMLVARPFKNALGCMPLLLGRSLSDARIASMTPACHRRSGRRRWALRLLARHWRRPGRIGSWSKARIRQMLWPTWVVPITGATGSALHAVSPFQPFRYAISGVIQPGRHNAFSGVSTKRRASFACPRHRAGLTGPRAPYHGGI